MRNMKRSVIAATIVALALSNMAAAETLAPGKPAGVKHAQTVETDTLLGIGLAAAAIGITIHTSMAILKRTAVSIATAARLIQSGSRRIPGCRWEAHSSPAMRRRTRS